MNISIISYTKSFLYIILLIELFLSPWAIATDGNLDSTFNSVGFENNFYPEFYSIVVQPNDKILVGGNFETVDGIERRGIARLNSDSTLDISFAPQLDKGSEITSIIVQLDGKVLIGGNFSISPSPIHDSTDGYPNFNLAHTDIARLNSDGSVDELFNTIDPNSFQNIVDTSVHALALQTDNKILIGGCSRIVRLIPNGYEIDTSFNVGLVDYGDYKGYGCIETIAIQKDGKILIAGRFDKVNDVKRWNVARLNIDGSLDTSFVVLKDITSYGIHLSSVVIQPDNKILIGGNFNTVVRIHQDGSLDTSFNLNLNYPNFFSHDGELSMALQADGKILVAGGDTLRLNNDGSEDNTFRSAIVGSQVAIQRDGKILVGKNGYYEGEGIIVRLTATPTIIQSETITPPVTIKPICSSIENSEESLAKKYAPILFLSAPAPIENLGGIDLGVELLNDEYPYTDYIPISVEDVLSSQQTLSYILSYPCDEDENEICENSPKEEEVYFTFYRELNPQPTIYYRVFCNPYQHNPIAIQYWFYYFYNDWASDHISDLEIITIFLDKEQNPVESVYSTHYEANRHSWNLLMPIDSDHKIIYVSNGGHGSYYRSGNTSYKTVDDNHEGNREPLFPNVTEFSNRPANNIYILKNLQPLELLSSSWLNYESAWGGNNDAPRGPRFRTDGHDRFLANNPPDDPYQDCKNRKPTKIYGEISYSKELTLEALESIRYFGPWYWASGYGIDGQDCIPTVRPNQVRLISPLDGETLSNTTPIFKWSINENARGYALMVYDSKQNLVHGENYPANEVCDSNMCSISFDKILPQDWFFWFAIPWNFTKDFIDSDPYNPSSFEIRY